MNCLFSILNAPKKFEKESKQTMLADVTPLSMAPRQQQTNLDHTKTPQGFLQNNKQIWISERTRQTRDARGSLFLLRGGVGWGRRKLEENFVGVGQGFLLNNKHHDTKNFT